MRSGYSALVKLHSASCTEFGLQSRTVKAGLGVRLLGVAHSDDFLCWSKPRRVFMPDESDTGVTEFYGMTTIRRGKQLIGFLRILRDDLPAISGGPVEGIGYTVLATSRDGDAWWRCREPFLDRSPDPGAVDAAFAWVYSVLEYDGRLWLFYAAFDEGHKVGRRRPRLAVLDRDRFVSWANSGSSAGRLTTRLLQLSAAECTGMWVNADASGGSIRVQLRTADGEVPDGYSYSDCVPVTADGLAQPVRFNGGRERLHKGPFRLEFALQEAELFGFSFLESA